MRFIKKEFCVRFVAGIVFSILLMSLEGFIFPGVVTAIEKKEPYKSSSPINQNTEDVSAFNGAEHWQFRDLDGKAIELGQLKGKVIFINIWATWCMPCVVEMQSIQKLYSAFQNEEIVFLIASNQNKNTVQRFYEKNNFTFSVYLIDYSLPTTFQTMSIPATFIINREGEIALKHIGATDWNHSSCHKFIRSLLSPQSDNSSERMTTNAAPEMSNGLSLVGNWEAQIPGNKYQMRVCWNEEKKRYEGVLIKQGPISQYAGFAVGELVWEATPTDNLNVMIQQQKLRWGANGVSRKYEWMNGTVYLDRGSTDELVTSIVKFYRVQER